MGKVFNLIKNEFIKIFKKLSTWIAIIVLVVLTAGFAIIMKFTLSMSSNYQVSDEEITNMTENYKQQISYAKESKYSGWENDVEKFQFYIDNNITANDWQFLQIQNAFDNRETYSETDFNTILKAFSDDDYQAYAKIMYDAIPDDQKEAYGWEYKYYMDNNTDPSSVEKWKSDLVTSISQNMVTKYDLENSQTSTDNADYHTACDAITLGEYRLQHNISVDIDKIQENQTNSYWTILYMGLSIVNLVAILGIIVAGGIVASEFSQGTIKFLLINPVKRWKILLSKYITVLVYNLILITLMFIIMTLMGMILCGTSELGMTYATIKNGTISSMPAMLYMLKLYALTSVSTIVISTLAFALSSVMRSSAFAIGVSMFIMFGGSMINSILKMAIGWDYGRFLIFANLDIVSIMNNVSVYENQTVGFALTVIAVHMVIFLWTAWDGFTRREV